MTWNITDCKDKYITAEKSNIHVYLPVSLSSSRSYHGNLKKKRIAYSVGLKQYDMQHFTSQERALLM